VRPSFLKRRAGDEFQRAIDSPTTFQYIGKRFPGVRENVRGGIPTVVPDVSIHHMKAANSSSMGKERSDVKTADACQPAGNPRESETHRCKSIEA